MHSLGSLMVSVTKYLLFNSFRGGITEELTLFFEKRWRRHQLRHHQYHQSTDLKILHQVRLASSDLKILLTAISSQQYMRGSWVTSPVIAVTQKKGGDTAELAEGLRTHTSGLTFHQLKRRPDLRQRFQSCISRCFYRPKGL